MIFSHLLKIMLMVCIIIHYMHHLVYNLNHFFIKILTGNACGYWINPQFLSLGHLSHLKNLHQAKTLPLLSRTFASPTVIHRPFPSFEDEAISVACLPVTSSSPKFSMSTQFFNCGGRITQGLDFVKTKYGWRVPYVGNGLGSAVKVYV